MALTSVMGGIVGGGVSAGAAVAGGTASAVGTVAGAAAGSATTQAAGADESSSTIEYFVDSLFLDGPAGATSGTARDAPQPAPFDDAQTDAAAERADAARQREAPSSTRRTRQLAREISEIPAGEVTRIFARALRIGSLPQEDERYIGQLIAQRTDLSQQEAQQRASEGFTKVQTTLQEMETTAREAADEARKATAYGALWMFVTLLMGAFTASLLAIFGGRQRDN